jgi:hypothetical protein
MTNNRHEFPTNKTFTIKDRYSEDAQDGNNVYDVQRMEAMPVQKKIAAVAHKMIKQYQYSLKCHWQHTYTHMHARTHTVNFVNRARKQRIQNNSRLIHSGRES